MGGGVKLDSSLRGDIGDQRALGFLEDTFDLIFGQNDAHHRQPPPQIGFDHRPDTEKLRGAAMGPDRDCGHTGAAKQPGQFFLIPNRKWRPQGVNRSLTCNPLNQRHLRRICGRMVKAIPDGYGQMSSGSQDSKHFAEGLAPIGEEHQAELAGYAVAAAI
jgi:hypothetical protein